MYSNYFSKLLNETRDEVRKSIIAQTLAQRAAAEDSLISTPSEITQNYDSTVSSIRDEYEKKGREAALVRGANLQGRRPDRPVPTEDNATTSQIVGDIASLGRGGPNLFNTEKAAPIRDKTLADYVERKKGSAREVHITSPEHPLWSTPEWLGYIKKLSTTRVVTGKKPDALSQTIGSPEPAEKMEPVLRIGARVEQFPERTAQSKGGRFAAMEVRKRTRVLPENMPSELKDLIKGAGSAAVSHASRQISDIVTSRMKGLPDQTTDYSRDPANGRVMVTTTLTSPAEPLVGRSSGLALDFEGKPRVAPTTGVLEPRTSRRISSVKKPMSRTDVIPT